LYYLVKREMTGVIGDQKVGEPFAFKRYRAAIDTELRAVLDDRQSPLYDMMRYHLGWVDEQGNPIKASPGKALRPTLCLLACEAVGGAWYKALPAAAGMELLHNFSLIHDDVQDDDRERRHRPTVWSIWGKPQAINAGDALATIAGLALIGLAQRGVPAAKQLLTTRLMYEACLTTIEGQYLDISYESRFDVVVGDYLEMIERKTAILIARSLGIWGLPSRSGMTYSVYGVMRRRRASPGAAIFGIGRNLSPLHMHLRRQRVRRGENWWIYTRRRQLEMRGYVLSWEFWMMLPRGTMPMV
jgi:hypothetical protein